MIKHLILQKIPKYDGYQCGLASMVYKFFCKNTALLDNSASNTKKEAVINFDLVFENKELAKELQKSIIKKSEK